MNEDEKEIAEKFKRLYLKDFNNEKITNEDRLSFIECALLSNLIERLQKENEELKENDNKYTIHLTDEQYNKVIEIVQNNINQRWIRKLKDNLIKNQEEYELLLEHQSGKESNRTKYLRGRIHMCQELLESEE